MWLEVGAVGRRRLWMETDAQGTITDQSRIIKQLAGRGGNSPRAISAKESIEATHGIVDQLRI